MKTKPDSFMPFFIADYLGDTMHLTTLQHGAYLLLLFHYWRTQGPLPSDPYQLAAIAKLPYRDWLSMQGVIGPFFIADGSLWRHKRCDHELAKALGKYGKRVAASEAAAAARAEKKAEAVGAPIPVEKRLRDLTQAEADLCVEATGVRRLKGSDLDIQRWRERVETKKAKRAA
jgi:uncharacterized protein YdaU (DUF1376 family)